MGVDYWQCGLCGVQLMFSDQLNADRFPGIRRFRDEWTETDLIAVRCTPCANMPYQLEEGHPHRIDLIGGDDVIIMTNLGYNYYPMGIGHVLEVFVSSPSEDELAGLRNDPIEIGLLVEEEVNLIVLFCGHGDRWTNVFSYCWHERSPLTRGNPPIGPISDEDRRFTVAYVDTRGGKFRVIRKLKMPSEFTIHLNKAIHNQMDLGEPNWEQYDLRIQNMADLFSDTTLESRLIARAFFE